MECRTVRGLLSDYLDGQNSWLSGSEAREIKAHLASCPGCRHLQLELSEIRTAARELPLRTPPKALWTRIVNEIEHEQVGVGQTVKSESWWSRLSALRLTLSFPQMAGAAALALVLISAGLTGLVGLRGSSNEVDFTQLQGALIREEMSKRAEIDRKMAAIEERKATWEPARRADFERQLSRIEESIQKCRQSLEASPNNLEQVKRMLDLYEEKRQLLEDVERLKW